MPDEQPDTEHRDLPTREASRSLKNRRIAAIGVAGVVVALAGAAVWGLTRTDSSSHAAATGGSSTSSTRPLGGAGKTSHLGGGPSTTPGSPTTPKNTASRTGQNVESKSTSSSLGPGPVPTTLWGSRPPVTRKTLPSTPETVAPDIEAAYVGGFQTECHHIWSIADADGLLWDPDALQNGGSNIASCLSQLVPAYAFAYNTVTDASAGGISDADDTANWLSLGGKLQNTSATRTWTSP